MVLPYESEDYGGAGGGAENISELLDVDITTAQDGELIYFNNNVSKWKNTENLLKIDYTYNNLHFGLNAGNAVTGSMENNVFIGKEAGQLLSLNNNNNVCIGYLAGQDADTNASNFIAIGNQTCLNKAGDNSINIGRESGHTKCPVNSVNIGYRTAYFNGNHADGNQSINIGNLAGSERPASASINIGASAGRVQNQGNCINIGNSTGRFGCGAASVSIGAYANYNGSYTRPYTICINATESILNNLHASSCVIKPIRAVDHKTGVGSLYYDNVTGELTQSSTYSTKFEAVFTADPTDITTSGSTIIFDTTNYNINSAYSTSTGQFTAPKVGLYRFECFFQLSTNDSLTLDWKLNGSVDKKEEVYNAHGGSSFRTFTTSYTADLNTNDTIEIAISAITGTIRFSSATKNGLLGYYIRQ